MENRLSDGEKVFIISGAESNFRIDGRKCEDFRSVVIESGVIDTTDGSARVRIATTDLLIGVKCELQSVEDSSSVHDRIRFAVDCSANASPQFEGKGGNEFAEELASALRTAYNNDYVVTDFEKLAVSPQHVWILHVDIVILQYGGSIIEAASLGVIAALANTEICCVATQPADENRVTVEMSESGDVWRLDTTRFPVIVSVNKLGKANVVDCTLNEETCVRSAVCFGYAFSHKEHISSCDKRLTVVRKMSGGSLDPISLREMATVALRVASSLYLSLHNYLKYETRKPAGHTFLA